MLLQWWHTLSVSQTLCHFLYSYSCYQVVAGRVTRWGDDPSRWLCSPPLFPLSIHSFLCFYLLVYLHVGICDFILCPSFLSLFIYLHLAFCDFTFCLRPDQAPVSVWSHFHSYISIFLLSSPYSYVANNRKQSIYIEIRRWEQRRKHTCPVWLCWVFTLSAVH